MPTAHPITVALEGGGSLGAFAWGVIDRLVDVPEMRIKVVSGTSAGAMNAAMLVQGLATGGPAQVRKLLEKFWRRVAISAGSIPGPLNVWTHQASNAMVPFVDAMRQTGAAWAPKMGPLPSNPLRGILQDLLEPKAFCLPDAPEMVIAATNVRTGDARLFRGTEISIDILLASACLPNVFKAVEIDGEFYWDRGYVSNPPLRPLIEAGTTTDVLIVRATPVERPKMPLGPAAIAQRVNEITFGSALRNELRTLALAQELLAGVRDLPTPVARLRDARIHMIGAEQEFQDMQGGSHQDPTWSFLTGMRDLGHESADRWLHANRANIDQRSTLDLPQFRGSKPDEAALQAAA